MRFFQRNAEVLLLEHAVEFGADRRRHFVGDQVEARAPGCGRPARRATISSKASGNCLANLLEPPFALASSATTAADAAVRADQRRRGGIGTPARAAGTIAADAPCRPRCSRNLRGVSVRVGLLEQQLAELPNCATAFSMNARPVVERLRRARSAWRLPCLLALAGAGQHVQPVFDARVAARRASIDRHAADQAGDADERGDRDDQRTHELQRRQLNVELACIDARH